METSEQDDSGKAYHKYFLSAKPENSKADDNSNIFYKDANGNYSS